MKPRNLKDLRGLLDALATKYEFFPEEQWGLLYGKLALAEACASVGDLNGMEFELRDLHRLILGFDDKEAQEIRIKILLVLLT